MALINQIFASGFFQKYQQTGEKLNLKCKSKREVLGVPYNIPNFFFYWKLAQKQNIQFNKE